MVRKKKSMEVKGLVHLKKKKTFADNFFSPPYHPRYPCLSVKSKSQKEMKVFNENITGFFSI